MDLHEKVMSELMRDAAEASGIKEDLLVEIPLNTKPLKLLTSEAKAANMFYVSSDNRTIIFKQNRDGTLKVFIWLTRFKSPEETANRLADYTFTMFEENGLDVPKTKTPNDYVKLAFPLMNCNKADLIESSLEEKNIRLVTRAAKVMML